MDQGRQGRQRGLSLSLSLSLCSLSLSISSLSLSLPLSPAPPLPARAFTVSVICDVDLGHFLLLLLLPFLLLFSSVGAAVVRCHVSKGGRRTKGLLAVHQEVQAEERRHYGLQGLSDRHGPRHALLPLRVPTWLVSLVIIIIIVVVRYYYLGGCARAHFSFPTPPSLPLPTQSRPSTYDQIKCYR